MAASWSPTRTRWGVVAGPQDPWGSWFEYCSDMDYIEDYSLWKPTHYALEDSLASWGPEAPDDFVHNYEADRIPAISGV
jgi:hypothetical protein